MGDCHNPKCHEEIMRTLDKKADKACLQEYMKKPKWPLVSLVVLGVLIPTVAVGMTMWRDQGKYTLRQESAIREERSIRNEKDIEFLKASIVDMKDTCKRIETKLDKAIE